MIGKFYDPYPPGPNNIMETILIIYQQYKGHFHLKQDLDLKIPLNGPDLVSNKTQNSIQADLL